MQTDYHGSCSCLIGVQLSSWLYFLGSVSGSTSFLVAYSLVASNLIRDRFFLSSPNTHSPRIILLPQWQTPSPCLRFWVQPPSYQWLVLPQWYLPCPCMQPRSKSPSYSDPSLNCIFPLPSIMNRFSLPPQRIQPQQMMPSWKLILTLIASLMLEGQLDYGATGSVSDYRKTIVPGYFWCCNCISWLTTGSPSYQTPLILMSSFSKRSSPYPEAWLFLNSPLQLLPLDHMMCPFPSAFPFLISPSQQKNSLPQITPLPVSSCPFSQSPTVLFFITCEAMLPSLSSVSSLNFGIA